MVILWIGFWNFKVFCIRRRGNDNFFRCTYVLPDGVTHTKGFVKDPDEAKKYLTVGDGAYLETRKDMDRTEIMDRKKVDLTKNVSSCYLWK